ncbi:phosphoglycerate mutase (2,3-diphosphoglycerate-independent) [Salvia divinorum]|uniref:Phosphoglycerate mutase (2,3-diphosphoglycerate-independent) n=1 Tax=Salvia divinorum TaxID=28513 RepID=A0ABD1IIJ0_SALDI
MIAKSRSQFRESPPHSIAHPRPSRLLSTNTNLKHFPLSLSSAIACPAQDQDPVVLPVVVFSASVLGTFDCTENGGPIECVSPKYAEIIVIRHGETEWNTNRRIQGHLDVDLNDVGRQQAVAVLYSSDLKRAFCTAEIIAKGCGVIEVTKEADLRERHLGDLQGVVFHEAHIVKLEAHKAFVSPREDQEIPGGGESFNQLYKRSTLALQRIAKKHQGERVVVVSHGGTIRALHKRASPHQRCGKVLNTSVNVFHLSKDEKWCIKSWGDVSHLNQTGFLDSGFGGDRNSG